MGFAVGKASPCVVYHPDRQNGLVAYGDEFTALGWEDKFVWYRCQAPSRFEARIGPGQKDSKSTTGLNVFAHRKDDGIKYEADQRHAEITIREIQLKEESEGLSTPGEPSKRRDQGIEAPEN